MIDKDFLKEKKKSLWKAFLFKMKIVAATLLVLIYSLLYLDF